MTDAQPTELENGPAPEAVAKRPSSARVLVVVGILALLAGSILKVNDRVFELVYRWLSAKSWIGPHQANELDAAIFFVEGLVLCSLTPLACGLTPGKGADWRRHAFPVLLLWVVPPLSVILVYGPFTTKPFHGIPVASWFWNSIAQELFFNGFIYARLRSLWGDGSGWRSAVSKPIIVTSLLFSLWHWPNSGWLSAEYMAFQFLYTFLGGCIVLQMRRLTGSILPCAANHVAVNYLAGVV